MNVVRTTTTALMLLAVAGGVAPLSSQTYRPAFDPGSLDDTPAGRPNSVVVLGTPHLSQLSERFTPAMAEPVVDRLAAWHPDAIAVEETAGLVCDTMRRNPERSDADTIAAYCYDTAVAGAATGLDVPAANAEAERLLDQWPEVPAPALRRQLAATFLAAGEPASALVQWLRLPEGERIAADGLTPALTAQLEAQMGRRNETTLIAARVAAKSGLERVWSVDDQSGYQGKLNDPDAYGAALSAAWDNAATQRRIAQGTALEQQLDQPGGLLEMYRAYNAPSYAADAYDSDWGAALREPSPQAYGRRYVAYWETRNLRMVANIREVLGRKPGTRLIAIVGASHKAYYEAYLNQMRDVALEDVAPLLQ
ncbi:DUF5694 domain-containing protein [Porphyrobacter sp. YT40]|uniref:DUF5694 domain-containing protein n=1 Tax=Porphyrobacter sp. YT40 TaxID=2547601 RepID=UPI002573FFCE|nr:DUF5694 domain-containing protein [Porphyrobacter sp. YT40]